MRKIILQEFVSLDQYAAGENGDAGFIPSAGTDTAVKELDLWQLDFLERVDCMLLGRKTYELFRAFWPTPQAEAEIVAPRLNSLKKYVFSNSLDHAPWGEGEAVAILDGTSYEALRRLKAQPGKDMVLWGSIDLAHSLLRTGLIDELSLFVCPTVLGRGRPLFPAGQPLDLRLQFTKSFATGVVLLHYGIVAANS